jgi:hypothetical protein
MDIKGMYGEPQYNTRAIQAGAIEYVTCPTCGAAAGAPCRFDKSGEAIPDFAHIGRRFEYVEGRGIFFGEPSLIPPQIWLRCKQERHAECLRVAPPTTLHPPDPCECPCHPKMSTSNVDDLLG